LLTLTELAASAIPQQPTPAQGAKIVAKWLQQSPEQRDRLTPQQPVPKASVEAVTQAIWATLRSEALLARKGEFARQKTSKDGAVQLLTVKAAGKEMKVLERTFGKAPKNGHSLWISMHGGGGTTAKANDGQWRNQIQLYKPKEGIYVAPRAPTNTWNLWHEGHIDDLFDRLIANYVIERGVNPDRVYLMGYSAGGDGVYQLAPRMADRFAAASMMAGHPNGVSMLSVRNLPFMIWMGAKDGAYQRNEMAALWGKKLDVLAAEDQDGYEHETHIVAGKGHWMNLEDAASVPWMAKRTRDAWPQKIVWHQTGRAHSRFYWLSVPAEFAQKGQTIRAEVVGQTISLQTERVDQVRLRLSDKLLDLDKEITVSRNGEQVFQGKVVRTVQALYESLNERMDPTSVASAHLMIGK
jgi:poly(3-hydroxybutyrate) depolymerase